MATGEETDDESLGGGDMHARTSGLADYLAEDEQDAIRIGRRIMARLNWRKLGPGPTMPADPPVLDPDQLLALGGGLLRRGLIGIQLGVFGGRRIREFLVHGISWLTGQLLSADERLNNGR